MPVSLDKVQAEAPHMVSLVKNVGVSLDKMGIDPSRYKAAVIATLDHSGSTEQPPNRLYSSGEMQQVADMAFAAGLQFDDDGAVPFSLFDGNVKPLGDMTLANCKGFVDQHRRYQFGGTNYTNALRWIVEEAGFGKVDLNPHGHRGLFRKGGGGTHEALGVKATAAYPTFAVFVTDGEPQDDHHTIADYLTLMSQLPIFVQFIGVGHHNFAFLRELDEYGGRFIDNANFFDAKDATDVNHMVELLLGEFPSYYVQARKQGLLV